MDKLEFFRGSSRGRFTTPEIDSHRPYVQGDDPRYIDWNLYARLDRFFIKTVVTEEEGLLHLVLDTSASMRQPHGSKQQCSLEIAAGISYLLLSSGNQLVIHSTGDRILQTRHFQRGEQQLMPLLMHLSNITHGRETDLGQVISGLNSFRSGQNVRTILLSDFIDLKEYLPQLNVLRTGGVRVGAIQVLHPREITPQFRGRIRFVDPETGKETQRLVGYRKLRSIRSTVTRFHDETSEAFKQQRIPFHRTSSLSPFEKAIIDFMSEPGWRGRE